MVMGIVLPDLVKNAQKDGNLYPLKEPHLFTSDLAQHSILRGWERHLMVDAAFHSSIFFKEQTYDLKQLILPLLADSPVKPFFLAHIGLELLLDHLLVADNVINIHTFYDLLNQADHPALNEFLKNCTVSDTDVFFNFLNNFISSRYLLSYQKLENISYALNRICMRLWNNPFTDMQLERLTLALSIFKQHIQVSYGLIFEEIELHLNSRETGLAP